MFDPPESDLYSYFIFRYEREGLVLEQYLSPKQTIQTYLNLLDRRMVDPKPFTILFGHVDGHVFDWHMGRGTWDSFCLDKTMINCFTL